MNRWLKLIPAVIVLTALILVAGCGTVVTPEAAPTTAATTAATSLATSAAASGAKSLTTTTLFMGYIANIQFAPIYVAMERGYFKAAGIDVKLEPSFDETAGLTRIGVNQLQFGLISGDQVLLARAKRAPVVYVLSNPISLPAIPRICGIYCYVLYNNMFFF